MSFYDQFDREFDLEGLKNDLVDAENGKSDEETPVGVYEVKITKLEMTKSKADKPMVACWFKIVAGERKDQMIFMNQVISSGFGLHKCNQFLRTLSDIPVTFESFKQYAVLLEDIMGEINGKYEYQLNYSKNKKDYPEYNIEKVFKVSGF